MTNNAINLKLPIACFNVGLSGDIANATGDGTVFTVPWDTATLNFGTYFNIATGIFTVPKTGIYSLKSNNWVDITGAAAATSSLRNITTATNLYTITSGLIGTQTTFSTWSGSYTSIPKFTDFSLTEGDEISVTITVSGTTKTMTVYQIDNSNVTAPIDNFFSGYLIAY